MLVDYTTNNTCEREFMLLVKTGSNMLYVFCNYGCEILHFILNCNALQCKDFEIDTSYLKQSPAYTFVDNV